MDTDLRALLVTPENESVVVRRLRAADGPSLQDFNARLSGETRALFLPHAYDDRTVGEVINRALGGTDRTYVACCRDRIVGYFFLWNFSQTVPVVGIGLTDGFQGLGIGRQLMHILIADARDAGCDGLELTSLLQNARALRLYRRLGFLDIKNVRNVAGDGRVVIEREMFLPLRPGVEPPEIEHRPPV
jgi:ribosomal protein S18 acetylase RimI-like enzyme